MSLPPAIPERSTAGIAVNPVTLERVVPESRRSDGSIRKEIQIRPGFTPQEDVSRFRSTRQQQMERLGNALPKGHILGWVAPSSETNPKPQEGDKSKNQKKKEKRKAKREQKKQEIIKANWEDDDEDDNAILTAKETKHAKSSPATSTHEMDIDSIPELEMEVEAMEIY